MGLEDSKKTWKLAVRCDREERMGGSLKELRPDPEKTRIRPHLHPAFSAGEKNIMRNWPVTVLAVKCVRMISSVRSFLPA